MIAGCLFIVQAAVAQSNPAISKEYSDETVAAMIQKHKSAHSRDVIPPAELAAKFRADFPKASDAEWELAEGVYEVEFDIRFRDCKAYYDAKGNLLMTVEEIYRSELPAVVRNTAETKYPKYRIEEVERIRRGTEVFYKIEMEHRDSEVKILVKSDGTALDGTFDL
jgi:cytochrome P450